MAEPAAGLLQHTSLRDQVLEHVRHALVSGEIRPGDIYSASALATRLRVSSSPVREAMLTLVNQGLLEPVRNRGFRVVPMSDRDLDEVYEMRVLLELPGTLKAAARITDADLDRLRALAGDIEDAAEAGDVVRFLDADRHFHLDLLACGGNGRLVDAVATLRDQTRLYGLENLAERGTLADSAREHREILAAIADRDSARLEELVHAHLRHIRADWAQTQD
ncbi:GntR family transcriptional regulator [Amycolatopsis samaneae]|uniref:GntR family transcriptional regulator n=1 Tax=Amycolatopsis samaneae TaxID=664691 RepID=A0ABW5GYA6_9PSEU